MEELARRRRAGVADEQEERSVPQDYNYEAALSQGFASAANPGGATWSGDASPGMLESGEAAECLESTRLPIASPFHSEKVKAEVALKRTRPNTLDDDASRLCPEVNEAALGDTYRDASLEPNYATSLGPLRSAGMAPRVARVETSGSVTSPERNGEAVGLNLAGADGSGSGVKDCDAQVQDILGAEQRVHVSQSDRGRPEGDDQRELIPATEPGSRIEYLLEQVIEENRALKRRLEQVESQSSWHSAGTPQELAPWMSPASFAVGRGASEFMMAPDHRSVNVQCATVSAMDFPGQEGLILVEVSIMKDILYLLGARLFGLRLDRRRFRRGSLVGDSGCSGWKIALSVRGVWVEDWGLVSVMSGLQRQGIGQRQIFQGLSPSADVWFNCVEVAATKWYNQWLTAEDVITNRWLTTSSILFRVMCIYQPGGASERAHLLLIQAECEAASLVVDGVSQKGKGRGKPRRELAKAQNASGTVDVTSNAASEALIAEAAKILKGVTLKAVRASDFGIDPAWVIAAIASASDARYALIDSGATNALRQAQPGEIEKARAIKVDLASGGADLHVNGSGTLLSSSPCQLILPAGYLVELGYEISWRKRGCKIKKASGSRLDVKVVKGCPLISREDGLRLLEEYEARKENPGIRAVDGSGQCDLPKGLCKENARQWLASRVKLVGRVECTDLKFFLSFEEALLRGLGVMFWCDCLSLISTLRLPGFRASSGIPLSRGVEDGTEWEVEFPYEIKDEGWTDRTVASHSNAIRLCRVLSQEISGFNEVEVDFGDSLRLLQNAESERDWYEGLLWDEYLRESVFTVKVLQTDVPLNGDDGSTVAAELFLQTRTVSIGEARQELSMWIPSAKEEVTSLEDVHKAVWRIQIPEIEELVKAGHRVVQVPGKAVLTRKAGVGKRRFRCVACGNFIPQAEGEAGNLYASGVEGVTLRVAIAFATQQSWSGVSADIKTAFLNAPLECGFESGTEEVIIVRPPSILVEMGLMEERDRWRVVKALYGLRQAPRAWAVHRDKILTTFKFSSGDKFYVLRQSISDESFWYVLEDNCADCTWRAIMLVYVDDILALGPVDLLSALIRDIQQVWTLSEPTWISRGKAVKFCGLELEALDNGFRISQSDYLQELFSRYNITCSASSPLLKWSDPADEQPLNPEKVREAQGITGALLWASTKSRPDVAFAVSKMGQYAVRAPNAVIQVGYQVLRFLYGTVDVGIEYRLSGGSEWCDAPVPRTLSTLELFTDASHAPEGGRSCQAIFLVWCGMLIAWEASKQPFVTLSSAESELVSVVAGIVAAESVGAIIEELIADDVVISALCDNQAAVRAFSSGSLGWRNRHLRMRAAAGWGEHFKRFGAFFKRSGWGEHFKRFGAFFKRSGWGEHFKPFRAFFKRSGRIDMRAADADQAGDRAGSEVQEPEDVDDDFESSVSSHFDDPGIDAVPHGVEPVGDPPLRVPAWAQFFDIGDFGLESSEEEESISTTEPSVFSEVFSSESAVSSEVRACEPHGDGLAQSSEANWWSVLIAVLICWVFLGCIVIAEALDEDLGTCSLGSEQQALQIRSTIEDVVTPRSESEGDLQGSCWWEVFKILLTVGTWEILRAFRRKCRRSAVRTAESQTRELVEVPLPLPDGIKHRARILYCLWRAGYSVEAEGYPEEVRDEFLWLVGNRLRERARDSGSSSSG
ncbi:RE1 [Symbiodinium natans]|uniref:RE1 protein n=1 Tax=Symbiodinium natans TaxID=878477 RepID=A0A812J5X0_9DINO|nr:RE1 [Symbiodinium natans]